MAHAVLRKEPAVSYFSSQVDEKIGFCRFMIMHDKLVLLAWQGAVHILEAYILVSMPLYGFSWKKVPSIP